MPFLKLLLGATVLSSVAAPRAAAHTTHFVPQEHPTIASAVGNAHDGDTIIISGGTYPEVVVVDGFTDLTILGKGKVIIDPPGDADALSLSNCTGCTVKNVRTTGAITGIKLLACTGGILLKCRAEAVSGIGIALDECDGVTVEACLVEDTLGDGIALGVQAAIPSINCILLKNKVFGAGEDGIHVSGDGNTIEKCLVKESAADGYRTESEPPATANTFTGNKAIETVGHGFHIQGDDNVVQECKAIKAGQNGAELSDGSGHVVQDCKFIKPTFDGIFAVDTALDVTLSGNTFKKPGANGIDVD
ncbi:MAG TPA: right-handed parallel beta-helix repeat-containing protein, partial [Planctomycetota bacterium]|nr:right-handed parallel beta-helix repeat-containing protein [Planctomycetota bacterium]